MQLKSGTLLQGGKYKIESVLGQGGFGITYLAVQTGLNRKVAVKEFFMKEYCERDINDSRVSLGTSSSREMVERFKNKFIKEAQTLAWIQNHHVVKVYDVFEENGTAYYVMEYLPGGDLASRIPEGGLSEADALPYVRQVAEALAYVHSMLILHLDVKPRNVLFREVDEAVLIDFGISKHYDGDEGGQTSSTPVGVSKGYAPIEQYRNSGVSRFSPATDVYSLGATLYKLLSGQTPPDASEVYENGLPPLPKTVSVTVREAIEKALSPRRKDRPQSVAEFMELLDAAVVSGEVIDEETEVGAGDKLHLQPAPKSHSLKWLWALLMGVIASVVLFFVFIDRPIQDPEPVIEPVVEPVIESVVEPVVVKETSVVVEPTAAPDPLTFEWESDFQKYQSLVEMGLEFSRNDVTLSQAKSKLTEAMTYERKYKNTSYSSKFSKKASSLLKVVENRLTELAEAERTAVAAAQAEVERLAQEQKQREQIEQEQREREQKEREAAEHKRNETSYKDGILRVKGIEYPMVYVSGGSFDMGATLELRSDAGGDEKPVHRVTLSSYRIGKYEVTQDLWEAVMGSNPSKHRGLRKPVGGVSWNDCQEFIRKLNVLTGASFRLPTEAEWEFAARGGNSSLGYKYSGSNSIDAVAWYDGNSGNTTHNVGTKSPNELGLYDMSGNVREWCGDRYSYYDNSPQTDPLGPSKGSFRVIRGSSWDERAKYSRVSYRNRDTPGSHSDGLGLRLCL